MNAEFFEALAMLEKERGLPADYLLEKIKNAIVIAVKKDYEVEDENVSVVIEPDQGKFSVSLLKTVVEEVEDPATEISLEEAQQKKKSCKAGDEYAIPLKTKDFGRIAAQTAKHVIRQGLKEAERSQMYAEMQSKAHEIISAVVTNSWARAAWPRCPATSRSPVRSCARASMSRYMLWMLWRPSAARA